jgi:nicotinamide-nucleotide amidase
VISYSNDAKERFLAVSHRALATKGAVSEEVANQMASGVRKKFKASIGIGITGIAGPTGATPTKPVGLVYIAVSSGDRSVSVSNNFGGSRENVKTQAAEKALQLLKDFLGERA